MIENIEVNIQNSIRIASRVGVIYVDPLEISDDRHDRIKAEKRKENRKKIWRTLTGKKQTAGVGADACRSMNYSDVVHILETQELYLPTYCCTLSIFC